MATNEQLNDDQLGRAINYARDDVGLTHLHAACQAGADDVLERFLDAGHDPNSIDPRTGDAPLHLAMRSGHGKLVARLLRAGANPNSANAAGDRPLHACGDCDAARILFEICEEERRETRVDIEARNDAGSTPLHSALRQGRTSLAELLLRRGADPNSREHDETRRTPLHVICEHADYGDRSMEPFLAICDEMNRQVLIDAKDELGRTPLDRALTNMRPDLMELLMDRGADLDEVLRPDDDESDEENLDEEHPYDHQLRLVAGVVGVYECLEKHDYALGRENALMILKFWANAKKKSQDHDGGGDWWNDEDFAREAKKLMIRPDLSLHDLIRVEEPEGLGLGYRDYWELARTNTLSKRLASVTPRLVLACTMHVCEKASRGLFKRATIALAKSLNETSEDDDSE